MTIVVLLVVVAVVGGVIVVMAGRFGGEGEFAPDRPYFVLPDEPVDASTVDGVRFAVGLRGYRMDQVDAVMDRLADELTDRDRQLAELRGEPFVEPVRDRTTEPVEVAEPADDAARD